ncbi:MAG: hypothetical protein EXR69_00290 [Myxococcales bacterium]|nr:hypothetical protein [Myxococcales bacterium]
MLIPLLALIGCNHPDPAGLECTATASPIPMLLNLAWTAPSATTRSWVEFTTADGVEHTSADAESPTEVAVTLYGAGPEEVISWTGHSVDELGSTRTCAGETVTGRLNSRVPTLNVTNDNGGWDPEVNYFLGVFYEMAGTVSHVFVVDRTGRYLWVMATDDGYIGVDVHLPRDGRGVLFNQLSRDFSSDESDIRRVDWDGTDLSRTTTTLAHHTFAELPDGTLAYQQIDPRDVVNEDGVTESWIGDAIVEVPPGGEGTRVWSIWDWVDPVWNDDMDSISLYGGLDWSHGNMLSYSDTTNQYLTSFSHLKMLFDIDRSTMTPSRQLGPPGYGYAEGSTPFSNQHSPVYEHDDPSTLMIFSTPTDGSNSGAFEYAIDDDDGTLTELWRHQGHDVAFCLGQALPMPSSHVLINYGCSASITEIAREDGLIRWELDSDPGSGFGQVIPLAMLPWEL